MGIEKLMGELISFTYSPLAVKNFPWRKNFFQTVVDLVF